jgi:hypothetical protein
MHFLSSEKELRLDNISLIYFYSHDNIFPISKQIFSILNNIETKIDKDILCIDIDYFGNIVKRFDIETTPTFIFFSGGIEIRRITRVPKLDEIEQTIKTLDI